MKAKEYFAKYEADALNEETCLKAITGILRELSDEVEPLCKSRHADTNAALAGVLKEINQKWNAISSLFEKKYGASPLKRNGFLEFWKDRIPDIKDIL